MCGITGYIGYDEAYKYLIFGLKMLLNRGYDATGMCTINSNNKFILSKYASEINSPAILKLEKDKSIFNGCDIGMAHSRWACVGPKTTPNAHPFISYNGKFSLVHNGIIENYAVLRKELIEKHNISFKSQTDSEVIVNLIEFYYEQYKDTQKAINETLNRLEGTWGLVILCIDEPNNMYIARHGSPLLVGFSDDNTFMIVASEQSGFCKYVSHYFCLNDNDLVLLTKNNGTVKFNKTHKYDVRTVTSNVGALTPYPYKHWTIKEIYEQQESSLRAMGMGGRLINDKKVKLGGLERHIDDLKDIDNLILLGCGTSYHAGLLSLNIFKRVAGFNTVQIFDGAEFTKYDIPKNGKTAVIMLSQSGETKDLHRCVKISKDNGLFMMGVINVVDSMIAREVNCGVYLNAGREFSVASTKSFTSQVIVLHLIAVWFAQIKNINTSLRYNIIKGLRNLSMDIKNTIKNNRDICKKAAKYLVNHSSTFILGKKECEASAYEAALKIKEISYINAAGYSTSSLKHGSFAILVPSFPIIIIAPDDCNFSYNMNMVEQLNSREAYVICISDKKIINTKCNIMIQIPKNETFASLLSVIPTQLIAYEIALLKDIPCDTPRNLAKICTTY